MDLDLYQQLATGTAQYPGEKTAAGLSYVALGLNGEAGEVAEQVKKMLRDDDGHLSNERREKIIKELGDTLWYASQVAREIGVSLSEVGNTNLSKLLDRYERDQISGEGDDR